MSDNSDQDNLNQSYHQDPLQTIATLKRRRGHIKAALTRVTSFIDRFTHSPDAVSEAASRLSALPSLLQQFEIVQTKIEEIDIENDEQHSLDRDDFETKYHSTAGRLTRLIKSTLQPEISYACDTNATHREQTPLSQGSSGAMSIRSHLPRLPLEQFDGDYNKWQRFFNCFKSRIHNEPSLTHIDKFHFLRSCLTGPPLDLINSLEVNELCYDNAMSVLKQRYDRKRLITESHIRSLLELPKLTNSTACDLRNFLLNFSTHLEALRALSRPVKHWDDLLVGIVRAKLDTKTLEQWELSITVNTEVSIKHLTEFLESRAGSLESFESQTSTYTGTKPLKQKKSYNSTSLIATQASQEKCPACAEPHKVYRCERFKSMSIQDRYDTIKKHKLCFNCFSPEHTVYECKASLCRHCHRKHNSMLHGLPYQKKSVSDLSQPSKPTASTDNNISSPSDNEIQSTVALQMATTTLHEYSVSSQVLLSTAIVYLQDNKGNLHQCRAVLDCGSHINILSQRIAALLELPSQRSTLQISGVNGVSTKPSKCCQVLIKSRHSQFSSIINCQVLPVVTMPLPALNLDTSSWSIPTSVQQSLADPQFHSTSNIDLLLGNEIFFEVLLSEKIALQGGSPWLCKTLLGWIVAGRTKSQPLKVNKEPKPHISCLLSVTGWMSPHQSPTRTNENEACEKMFKDTHKRGADGKFIVHLPFTQDPAVLGDSHNMAVQRFLSVEKRLMKDPILRSNYVDFMSEYHLLGHMSKVDNPGTHTEGYYYLPHHAVVKESSTTTKVRVVFDGSAKSTTGKSLNDILAPGPTTQPELFDILLRLRSHIVVITADVAKMFRQVWVQPQDCNYQRIVWRASPEHELQHYQLNTVTYGTASASFLSTRVLQEIASSVASKSSTAAQSIKSDFYMDDYISGSDSIEEALTLFRDVSQALKTGGMMLRKWCSNNAAVRQYISEVSDEPHFSLDLGNQDTIRSLGLVWCPEKDQLTYSISQREHVDTRTKRSLLSSLNSIFDPLGFLGPVLIRGKVFLQELWQIKVNWDDQLPLSIQKRWETFTKDLENLDQLFIPRSVKYNPHGEIQLHGFCDASQIAYGGCVYFRQQVNDELWHVQLVCAKSRVAPTKTQTIPRLELCGAHLLAELISRVAKSMGLSLHNTYCWTDSTVALTWIQGESSQWKTYVANRVTQINETVKQQNWSHVSTSLNPADPLSRGVSATELLNLSLWWSGPEFLQKRLINNRCKEEFQPPDDNTLERRQLKFTLTTTINQFSLSNLISNWSKLLRISAIWLRFISWLRWRQNSQNVKPILGPIRVAELQVVKWRWIQFVQNQEFAAEIKILSSGGLITKGPLKCLSPFMKDGVLYVGGRLQHSDEPFGRKHPAVLPSNNNITNMIFQALHLRLLHIGPQGLLANMRSEFWPLRGRDNARKIVHLCQKCFRARPIPLQQPMGQLPKQRVTPSKPFSITGVDFAGPIQVRTGLRKIVLVKAYIAVFVCMATKAVHLELVSSLTSEAFLAALRRFTSRRGLPSQIWSDNGTNFVGARKELRCYLASTPNTKSVAEILVDDGIQWVFIPPNAPHFGGLWESAVKSCKHHLYRAMNSAHFNFEELTTLLTQVEACLNSRPLTALSSDPGDHQPLTPGHFLVGAPLLALPDNDVTEIPSNRLKRWKLVQKAFQLFWKRWREEYLSSLQGKSKWIQSPSQIEIGTLAVLKEDNSPPLSWRLVRVIATHPGQDGVVRVVTLRTPSGTEIIRPVVKICPLPASI